MRIVGWLYFDSENQIESDQFVVCLIDWCKGFDLIILHLLGRSGNWLSLDLGLPILVGVDKGDDDSWGELQNSIEVD